jgi:1-acyl-sn-glycerol-3-phosphate acyltransferase
MLTTIIKPRILLTIPILFFFMRNNDVFILGICEGNK